MTQLKDVHSLNPAVSQTLFYIATKSQVLNLEPANVYHAPQMQMAAPHPVDPPRAASLRTVFAPAPDRGRRLGRRRRVAVPGVTAAPRTSVAGCR